MGLLQSFVGSADLSTRGLVGSLNGGYFVTTDITTAVELRHVMEPGTILDSVTLTTDIWELQTEAYGAQDAQGHLYALQSGTAALAPQRLLSITQSAGALTVGTVSTVSSYAGYDLLWVSNDGAEVILQDGNDVYAYDAATGSAAWDLQTATVLGFGYVCGFPSAGRMVYENTDAAPDVYQLTDDAGTVLDTATVTLSADSYAEGRSGDDGAGIVIAAMDADETTLYVNVLDATGDSLTWVHATNVSITTGWDEGQVKVATWRDTAIVAPWRGLTPFPDKNLIWVRPRTGAYAMASTAYLNRGADVVRLAGSNASVVDSAGTGTDWSTWRGPSSVLRQRQSPKRTPSRVRGVDLRQRQTPYIR